MTRPLLRLTHIARAVLIAAALAGVLMAVPAHADDHGVELWGTNGTVFAQVRAGNTLYLGGDFGAIGPCTGGGVPLDPHTGAPLDHYPRVCGSVGAAVPDGSGGWFIGGSFTAVEGAPRTSLAHLRADGRVSAWHPTLAGEAVFALARHGRRLYVGGAFSLVNGTPRTGLAAVDAVTGELLDWSPEVDGEVRCLLVHGGALFAGGAFSRAGGQAHANLVRFDLASGQASTWNGDTDGRVLSLARLDRTLLVGGEFDHAGGQPRNSLAALDLRTGSATGWNAGLAPRRLYLAHGNYIWPYVAAITVHRGTVFVGGWFTHAGEQPRVAMAALDARTAEPTAFDARLPGSFDVVTAITARGNTVYIGGGFGEVGGQPRNNLAALEATSGNVESWDPRAAEQVYTRTAGRPGDPRIRGVIDALVAGDDEIFAGGRFTSIHDWQARGFLAALDLTTGRATSWEPRAEGLAVTGLDVQDDRVYLTGPFRAVNGEPRDHIAVVDTARGTLREWGPQTAGTALAPGTASPAATSVVYSFFPSLIAVRGSTVYVAGDFIEGLTGRERFHIAAFDATTGSMLPWNPKADGPISGMLLSGNTIYAGGLFSFFGGIRHPWLGAVDANSAVGLPWYPQPQGSPVTFSPLVAAFVRSGGAVYLGGAFGSMGGVSRPWLAAVDTLAGGLLPWEPDPDGTVFALASSGRTIWVGGAFGRIASHDQPFLAALDDSTGTLSGEQPRVDGNVRSLLVSGDEVYAAGEFRSVGGFPLCGVARVRGTLAGPRGRGESGFAPGGHLAMRVLSATPTPTPARAAMRLDFTLGHAGLVSLTVFDLQGRRVASVLDRVPLSAGSHVASIPTQGLSPGLYLYRLAMDGASLADKMIVVR